MANLSDRFPLRCAKTEDSSYLRTLRVFLGIDDSPEAWREAFSGEFMLFLLKDGRISKKFWKELKWSQVHSFCRDLMWAWHEDWAVEPKRFYPDELAIPMATLDAVLPRLSEEERVPMDEKVYNARECVYISSSVLEGDGFRMNS